MHSDKTEWLQSPYNRYEYYYFASLVCIYIISCSRVRCYCDDYNAWRLFTSEVSDARAVEIIISFSGPYIILYSELLAATVRFTWPIFARTSDQTAPKVVIACKTRTNECTHKLNSARREYTTQIQSAHLTVQQYHFNSYYLK